MAAPRRARRRPNHRDDCDEVPIRIRKGEMGTLTDNFGLHADTGAQICDGFYTSTYQLAHCNVLPTSPAVEVPEFPVQRMEPCRTLGNFEVGSAYDCRRRSRSQSPSGFRLRNVSPIGSHSPRPDKDGEAFANSLRKYPTSSDRLPTALLLQKLIKQAQDKYSAKTSQPPKMRNISEKISPVIQGSRSSKNLQTTRSRNDSPKNEVQATKKGRSGFTSPSPQCSREIVAEGTYDYLNTDPETRGDRARGSVASTLRQMFGGTRAMVAYPICPKILSRYEQHRKQHHTSDEQNPQDGQASGSKGFFPWPTCEPVDASTSCPHQRPCQPKPSICLCRELRASEDDLQERLRLQEIVCAWLDNLPVSAKEKPQDKFMRDALIRKLIDTLSGMNDEEFDAKGKEEIGKCVNDIPMWLPQQDSEKFKQELVDNLFERIKGFRKRDRFKDVIAKWLDKIEFTEDVNRDEIVSTFSSALKEIALNRPTNDGIYRDKLKTKAYELLEALPIAADTDREGLLALKAEQLADELVSLPKDQVKPDSYFEADSDEMTQLKALEAFAKGIQDREFGAIIMKALNEVNGLRELSSEIKEKEIKDLISKLPNLLTDEEEFAAKETYDQVHRFLDKIAGDNAVNLEDKIKVKFMDNLVDNLEDTFAHHLELGESMSKFLVDLPKPPKPTPAQPGTTAAQLPDKTQTTSKTSKGKVNIQDPRSLKEESLPTDQRVTLSQQETGQRRVEDRISPTPNDDRKSPEKLPERQRPVGESYLEDRPSGIDAKGARVSTPDYQGDQGSPTNIQTRKRVSTPKGSSEKRRLSGKSLEDDGSTTIQGLASGRSDRSPQKPSEKRRVSAESYLEDEKSPTGQGLASKRGKSPQKPTGERRVSGQSDLEDESPTTRKTVGVRRGRQAEKRPVSGQSYMEDDGSPTSQGLAGKRSASPRGQAEKRRLSGQSYSEDQDVSTGRKAVGGVRSPQAEKRRFSAQSYLENDGRPIGQGSPDGKISISPRGQTDRHRLSGQSYVEDDGSPSGRRAVEGTRDLQAEKRRYSGQSNIEDNGQASFGGKRGLSPRGQTEKRRISGQSYLEENGSPTDRKAVGGTRSLQSDKRRVSDHSYLEDDRITTGQRLASDKREFPQKPTDKRHVTGQSYLEEGVSPTGRKAVASTRSRQADKRRASGQSYLEDDGSPTGQFSPGGKRSISPRGRSDKRRPSGQSLEDEVDSPASQGLTRGKSPRGLTGKRRISGESYLEDDGSPTGQGSPVDKRSSARGRTEKRRITGQSYLDDFSPVPQQRDDFGPFIRTRDALSPASSRRDNVTPAIQSKDETRSTSPIRQTDKRRLSGQNHLEDFSPTSQRRDDFSPASQRRDSTRNTSPQRQTDRRRISGQSYVEDDFSSESQQRDAFGPTSQRKDGTRSTSPQRQTDKRRFSGQSYVEDDFGSASQKRDDFGPASQRKDVTRSTSPHKATGKRRLSGQSYVEDDFELASQRSDDFGHISQRKDDYSDKRRYSGQSYLDEGTPTSLVTKGSAIPQQADDKRQGKDKYGDTSGPPYDSPSPRPHGRRPSIDIIGKGSPRSYGQSTPEDKASERMPMRPTIIDIESPDEIPLAKRDAIPTGQRFGPGKLRNYQVYDKTGVSNQVHLSKRDVILTGQRLGSDQLRNNNQVYDKTGVSDQVQVSGKFDTDKETTLAEDRSKEDKAYSKEMGYLSDKSGMSDQPTVTKNYLKERDDVSKTKDKIESQTPVGKHVQVTEPQAKSYISDSQEPGKGISQVDSKEIGGQVLPQSKGLIIDDKQAKPNDIGKVAKSQQKAESKSPESGSSKVQTSGEQDSKETSGDKISSAQKTVGLKPQGEEKKRPSLNAESSIGLSPSQLKPHMKDEGKNTVKKMKSFLGRYRKRVGLKKSGELTEVEETPESLTKDGSFSERLDQRRVSFSSDENILGSSHKRAMKNGVHDILDLTGPNLKNKSEVELKLADLLEDLVMRGMDEDSAWEQLLSILGPDVTLEDAHDIFSKLMGTAHEMSASMDPEGISRIARGRGASTPKKDKMTGGKEGQELEFDGELDDEFDDEFGGKFDDGDDEFDDEWESEFDGKTDKEREQERLRKEAEKEYNRIMFDNVKEWMGDNHILRTDAERDAVAQQLANDFVDRQKYLQLNPDAKTSPAEELEHMKYQVFKRINKLLDPEEVNAVMVKVPELMERIKNVPVPQLTKGAKGAFVASPEEFRDAITEWMKKTPLFKKQSEKQKDAMLNEMVPNIAEGLGAAVQPFLTGISNENPDKVLIEEIVKNFKKTLPPREARASLLEGMGKDLLKHLKELQLIPDNLNASVLGTSAMSGFNDVVSKWCNQLPIPNTEQGNKIKHDLANNIMAEIGELNMNPQILNDDILYDDILADFLEVQLNAVPDEIDNKEALITELLEEVKKLRQPLQHIMAGKLYNEKLRDAVDKTLPPIDKRNEAEEASFEIMKDNLADAFINLHYVGGNCALRNIFKNKINDEIDKFANEYLARHPNEPLCRTQLKKNMYSALKKVDVPGEESMKSEVERVRMKDLIDEWAKELPMKCQSPAELLHTNKVLKAMTQRILDLEKENQLNPSDDYDEKLEKEIEKFVKRLPVIERSSLKEQQNLAKMLKDTQQSRTYTEGSRRSIEDLSASVCQPLQKEAKSASLSGLCQHCRSSVMQSSRSYEPSCKDAALSPPPIDCCSQTEVVHKQDRFAQCKCSKTELSRVEPCPSKSCLSKSGPSKSCPSRPCPSKTCPDINPSPSRNPCPAKQHVSTPCNTPRPRVSTGSQAHITPYIIVDDDDTPTDQASVCLSNPCLSSISIPKHVPCGTTTLEPCYSPPCAAKATKLGSFDNNEYKSCTRRKIRNVDTQRESCFHSPRKVWSRPQSYRDTIPCAPLNNTGCRGQMQNCRSRRCYGHDPMMACPKCCGMKCPHPAKFYFR